MLVLVSQTTHQNKNSRSDMLLLVLIQYLFLFCFLCVFPQVLELAYLWSAMHHVGVLSLFTPVLYIYIYTDIQTYRHTDIQTYRYFTVHIYKHTNIHIYIVTSVIISSCICICICSSFLFPCFRLAPWPWVLCMNCLQPFDLSQG